MALNSDNIMLPGKGYILLDEPGADTEPNYLELEAFAADTSKTPKTSKILGHTSRENLVAMGRDGGDSNILGSWEQEQIENVQTGAATEYIDAQALQFDNDIFGLYYGGGDTSQVARYAVPKDAVPQKKRLTIVYLTRGKVVGQTFAVTSVKGEDVMEHSVDAFSIVPLRFTVLDSTDGADRQVWIGRQFGQPVPGTPTTPTEPTEPVTPTPAVPDLVSLDPATGIEAGGEDITLTGANFTDVTDVTFGDEPADFIVDSATKITATAPAGTGTVDVTVTSADGSDTLTGAYTYTA